MSATDSLLVHDVYFSLNDRSAEARQKLIHACRKYLPGHPGIVFFAVGGLAEELSRDVNDRDWDVGLHIIFKDQSAHDAYQETEAHHAFIAENKPSWKKVRVFDTLASQSPTP
ncbi:MAG: Dabb family protein [Gemmataceae bacterium]